ncbi:MAG: hypothetical protein QOH75_486 [Actinomycetota bacterium]|nr:hypothetical protein [Actinomycetota bacterium]
MRGGPAHYPDHMADGDLDIPQSSWAAARAGLAADVRRVVDRLRGLSQARLAAGAPPHQSRAAAARRAAQLIADAAQGIEEHDGDIEPAWRTLPTLHDFAVGDQVAVTGQDLLIAAAEVAPDTPVWARGRRRTAHEVLADAATQLGELRRLL